MRRNWKTPVYISDVWQMYISVVYIFKTHRGDIINPSIAKLFNLNFHPLEVDSDEGDQRLNVARKDHVCNSVIMNNDSE